MTLPKQVKYDLGVQDNESVDSIFSKLGETSINFDGSYVSVDFGDIGKKHNVGLSFGFSTGGDTSLPDPSAVLQPDTSVHMSLTLPINNPIKLKKLGGLRL